MKNFDCSKYFRKLVYVLIIFALVTKLARADEDSTEWDYDDDYDCPAAPVCLRGTHPSGCKCGLNQNDCSEYNETLQSCVKCEESDFIELKVDNQYGDYCITKFPQFYIPIIIACVCFAYCCCICYGCIKNEKIKCNCYNDVCQCIRVCFKKLVCYNENDGGSSSCQRFCKKGNGATEPHEKQSPAFDKQDAKKKQDVWPKQENPDLYVENNQLNNYPLKNADIPNYNPNFPYNIIPLSNNQSFDDGSFNVDNPCQGIPMKQSIQMQQSNVNYTNNLDIQTVNRPESNFYQPPQPNKEYAKPQDQNLAYYNLQIENQILVNNTNNIQQNDDDPPPVYEPNFNYPSANQDQPN